LEFGEQAMIPVNVIFSPDWWNRRFGVSFEEPFYLDVETRIANDVLMRRALHELFGIGQPNPQPRPIIGSRHIAGGFIIPATLGVPIRFTAGQAAWPTPSNLDHDAARQLRAPDVAKTWPMSALIEQMDALQSRFGYVTGDLNTGGLVNNAVELRGNDLFADLKEDPELADHLLAIVAETVVGVSRILRQRTGTTSIAVNRSIVSVNPAIHLTSNCSVSMISPRLYESRVLPHELRMAELLAPYGIHHCGSNLQKYADAYNRMDLRFLDVGFGSDIEACGRLFPGAFLNLRMSPVRMLQGSEDQAYGDVLQALTACGRREKVGVCCINMDGDTPDANVRAMFRAATDFNAKMA
jgi:hypothetical protein